MHFIRLLFLVSTFLFSPISNGAILTFDETPALNAWTGGQLAQGFSLTAKTASSGSATNASQVGGGSYSGSNSMFNFNSLEAIIVRDTAFDFVGAYFMNDIRSNIGTTTFTLNGYDMLGATMYSSVFAINDDWNFINVGWNNIYSLGFDPLITQNMQMDDLTYNESSSSVPEPSILALMGLGLAGFFFTARRRKTV